MWFAGRHPTLSYPPPTFFESSLRWQAQQCPGHLECLGLILSRFHTTNNTLVATMTISQLCSMAPAGKIAIIFYLVNIYTFTVVF